MGKLRRIKNTENNKRGCIYCLDMVKVENGDVFTKHCKHSRCPYRELDGYESYKEYLEATEKDCGLLGMLKG